MTLVLILHTLGLNKQTSGRALRVFAKPCASDRVDRCMRSSLSSANPLPKEPDRQGNYQDKEAVIRYVGKQFPVATEDVIRQGYYLSSLAAPAAEGAHSLPLGPLLDVVTIVFCFA